LASESVLTPAQLRKAGFIATFATPLIRALAATYRWRIEGLEHFDAIVASGRQPIMGFWHGRILPATVYFRNRNIVVITSQNFDGEWIAGIIERFGYGTARGSTSRGGAKALVQLRRDLLAGKPVGFTLDGPRGPARVAQPGALFLAGATGYPILPFHLESSAAWTTKSWDRTQIPKPFSRVAVVVGESFFVPDTEEATIEAARVQLQDVLSNLERRAIALLNLGSS
jgi:lysophospholipid acyltransferase (LPLAT)-like uncharacterized protein